MIMEKSEIEKIRNRITWPIVDDAKKWMQRQPRSLDEKKAYSDAVWSVIHLIFPEGGQANHTMDRLEKLLFK
jgi:hypothetical protein